MRILGSILFVLGIVLGFLFMIVSRVGETDIPVSRYLIAGALAATGWLLKAKSKAAADLRITSLPEQARVFHCPNCKQIINTSVRLCPSCSIPIDRRAAEAAAELMGKVHLACSDATDLRTLFNFSPPSKAHLFLFGILGSYAIRLSVYAVVAPVVAIRWWVKFGSIRSDDPGFVHAKQDVLRISRNSAITLLVLVMLGVLIGVMKSLP